MQIHKCPLEGAAQTNLSAAAVLDNRRRGCRREKFHILPIKTKKSIVLSKSKSAYGLTESSKVRSKYNGHLK